MQKYDCTQEVNEHIALVQKWMEDFRYILAGRAKVHDQSKLRSPEKEMFDEFTWKLKNTKFGSDEYNQQLVNMGAALKHHYELNSHHPEHYGYMECNGCFERYPKDYDERCTVCGYSQMQFRGDVSKMTLYEVVEMVCDWMAAAEKKDVPVDLDYLQKRFDISPQLRSIIENQFREIDTETISNNAPRNIFGMRSKISEK